MWNAAIACGLFLLIGLVVGLAIGLSVGEYPLGIEPDPKDPKQTKNNGAKTTPGGSPKGTIHVVNPKSPSMVEFERQNKKPDVMKPE